MTAVETIKHIASDLDLEVVCYDKYGKGFMKKCVVVHPAACVRVTSLLCHLSSILTVGGVAAGARSGPMRSSRWPCSWRTTATLDASTPPTRRQ
jgi:hypothetical protein